MSVAQLTSIPLDPAWLEAIPMRVSTRAFDGRPADAPALDRVDGACGRLSAAFEGEARAVLVRECPAGIFTGIVGGYGGVTGAPSAVALIGRDKAPRDAGYLGEAIVLDATLAGLDTCWIAGLFDANRAARLVDLAGGERVVAVIPVGRAEEGTTVADRLRHALIKPRSRLALDEISPGVAGWPEWARAAAEAVRPAPSGVNGQPWRLRMEGGALQVCCKLDRPYWTAPIDCGIAMLHAELGATRAGVTGRWERVGDAEFARFVPEDRP